MKNVRAAGYRYLRVNGRSEYCGGAPLIDRITRCCDRLKRTGTRGRGKNEGDTDG